MSEKGYLGKLSMATLKGVIGSVPIPGSSLISEYIGLTQECIADKRFDDWKRKIEDVLQKLSDELNNLENLGKDEAFYSCVQLATVGAMQSYQEEKRQLFANAVYNSVFIDLVEDKKMYFLSLLNKYTMSHIQLLKYYSEDHYNIKNDSVVIEGTEHPIKSILESNSGFKDDINYVIAISNQLYSDSLIENIHFEVPVQPQNAMQKRSTNMGDEFIKFICNKI